MSIPVITRTVKDPGGNTDVIFSMKCDPRYHYGPDSVGGTIPYTEYYRLFEAYTPNSTKDHKTWKAFQHYRAEQTYVSRPNNTIVISRDNFNTNKELDATHVNNYRIFYTNNGWGEAGLFNNGQEAWYVPTASNGFIPEEAGLEELKLRGLRSMMPGIKAELQSLVSLYEIRDFISIKGTINNILRLWQQFGHLMRGDRFAIRTLKKMIPRVAGDGYLQWMFNLKPLVSDICGIYHTVANYERRINDFVNRSGKLQTAHFTCQLTKSSLPMTYINNGKPMPICYVSGNAQRLRGIYDLTKEVIPVSATFNCSMQYNYTLSAFQVEHAKLLGVLDMLGVTLNPEYVWNVIPWTFVIDWVFHVNDWLDQFEVKNLEPKVNILQYCWSVRKERYIKVKALVKSGRSYSVPGTYPPQYSHYPDIRETSYRRGIDLPSSSSFTMSGLSPTQLSLGAALLTTRRRRKPRSLATLVT